MKIIATIEARMTSSRLLGKVMAQIVGKPMLELLIERVKRAKKVDEVIIATTNNRDDDVIEILARRINVGLYRGSEDDVMKRVLEAALAYSADLIVELTGDNPLVEPLIIDDMINFYLNNDFDYVGNTSMRHTLNWKEELTFPVGTSVHVFSTKLLKKIAEAVHEPIYREHVSFYIYDHPELYRLGAFKAEGKYAPCRWPEARLTVDTEQDLEVIRIIFENLYPMNNAFTLFDVVNFLKRHPEVVEINSKVYQRKAYEEKEI